MKDMYANLERRFKFNGYLGEPVFSNQKRGALQGCAFSMVAMNVAALAWFAATRRGFNAELFAQAAPLVKATLVCSDADWPQTSSLLCSAGSPDVRSGGYADDLHAAGTSKEGLKRVHWLTILWAEALCIQLNPDKSVVLGNLHLSVGAQNLKCVEDAKLLGDVVTFSQDLLEQPDMPDARLNTCVSRLTRCAHLPGSKEDRLGAAALAAIPVLYGSEFSRINSEQIAELRTRVWEVARQGKGRPKYACMEVLMTICSKGHLVDPAQFLDYRALLSFTRLAKFDVASLADLSFIWQKFHSGGV